MNTAKERAFALLNELSVEEKLYQLSGEMLFEVGEDYETKRNPMHGNYRNAGHFACYIKKNCQTVRSCR